MKKVLELSVDRTRPYPTHRRQSLMLFLYIYTYKTIKRTYMHKIEITKKNTNMQKQEWSVDKTQSLNLFLCTSWVGHFARE